MKAPPGMPHDPPFGYPPCVRAPKENPSQSPPTPYSARSVSMVRISLIDVEQEGQGRCVDRRHQRAPAMGGRRRCCILFQTKRCIPTREFFEQERAKKKLTAQDSGRHWESREIGRGNRGRFMVAGSRASPATPADKLRYRVFIDMLFPCNALPDGAISHYATDKGACGIARAQ